MMIARLVSICAAVKNNMALVASRHLLFDHREEDRPTLVDIEYTVCAEDSEIIQNSPAQGAYHPSCIVRGEVPRDHRRRISHVVCTYPPNPVVLITAYWCDTRPMEWDEECRKRR